MGLPPTPKGGLEIEIPDVEVRSLKDVALAFGVHHDTVKKAWKGAGMPGKPGAYPLVRIALWRIQRLQEQHRAGSSADPESAAGLELRQLQIKVAREELKLRREANEVVGREAALASVEQIFHRVRSRLEAMPEEISASLPQAIRGEQLAVWKKKLQLVLRELEGWQT